MASRYTGREDGEARAATCLDDYGTECPRVSGVQKGVRCIALSMRDWGLS